MKTTNKIFLVLSKIAEIAHWIGAVSMIVLFALSIAGMYFPAQILDSGISENDAMLSTYCFEVSAINNSGEVNITAFIYFSIGAAIILSLMAMVFRNTYLIIKKSSNSTPFQKDNIRMLREIGIFAIAVPVVAFIMTLIIRVLTGNDSIETTARMDGLMTGILIFALTNVFAYGAELQEDVDGLV